MTDAEIDALWKQKTATYNQGVLDERARIEALMADGAWCVRGLSDLKLTIWPQASGIDFIQAGERYATWLRRRIAGDIK